MTPRRAPLSSRVPLALLLLVVPPASVAWLSTIGACMPEVVEARPGLAGDSCARTDDCDAPLRCIKNVCTAPAGAFDAGLSDAKGDGPSAADGPWSKCDECLEKECGAAEKACGDDCKAIEACIETLCANLSAVGSADEGKCQVECQNQHANGISQHLGIVNCAQESTCQPPCVFYPQDYEACVDFMNKGDCGGKNDTCNASADCNAYKDCVKNCSSFADCIACDDTPERLVGRAIYEDYQRCLAEECMTESWIK